MSQTDLKAVRNNISLTSACWPSTGPLEPAPGEGSTVLAMTETNPDEVTANGRSRVYAVLGRPEPALHHARRVLDLCQENGIGDWDLAFAYEALARARAVAGDTAQARHYTDQALSAAQDIAEDDERELVLADLETIPAQPRYW
jgi:tetratricopeptide (TPR) repeat protein